MTSHNNLLELEIYAKGKKILVVEDYYIVRKLFIKILEPFSIVKSARNGKEALAIFKKALVEAKKSLKVLQEPHLLLQVVLQAL